MATIGLPATTQEQAKFFAQLHQGFAEASARAGEVIRDFRIAGTSVRLRFAGDALISTIAPGLAHPVESLAAEPECEICLWDSESTRVALASPPRPWEDFTGRGNIWGFDSSRYRSAYHWGEGSVNVMDRETRRAFYWVPSYRQLPAWVLAAPLRSILHWWMELNGRQLVHAAVVGWDDCGVLIPGRGGSGKSSTAVACLLSGMDFISDDYLALALDPEPRAYRLYTTAKLDSRNLNLYPDLTARCRAVHQPDFDKVVLFLEDGYREQMRESLPLKQVLKPHISLMKETTLGSVEPREVECSLAAETLVHLPHAGVQTVEFLDRLARFVPRAAIHLGTDRAGIVTVIKRALQAKAATAAPRAGSGNRYPYVTVIVHLREEDREELKALAEGIEAQEYCRTEFIITADGAARAMAADAAKLPGNVRFLPYEETVVNGDAWNRGVRESFAELLMLIEPGDRFPPGALDALVNACELKPDAAWVRGRVLSSRTGDTSERPLCGAMIRKSAFRECGLFPTDPLLQGREQKDWLKRVEQQGLIGDCIETVTLHPAPKIRSLRLTHKVDLGLVRTLRDLRRRKTVE